MCFSLEIAIGIASLTVEGVDPTGESVLVDAVGFEAGVEDVVVAGADAPFAGGGVQVPLAEGVEDRGRAVEGKGAPLVVANAVAAKIAPAVAGEDDGGLAGAVDGDEEPGLSDMAEIEFGVSHDGLGAVGASDVHG